MVKIAANSCGLLATQAGPTSLNQSQTPMGFKETRDSHSFPNMTKCSLFISMYSSDCPVVFPFLVIIVFFQALLISRMLFALLDSPSTHKNWDFHEQTYPCLVVLGPILKWNLNQWPFQDPKLQAPWIRPMPMFQGISPENLAKHMSTPKKD